MYVTYFLLVTYTDQITLVRSFVVMPLYILFKFLLLSKFLFNLRRKVLSHLLTFFFFCSRTSFDKQMSRLVVRSVVYLLACTKSLLTNLLFMVSSNQEKKCQEMLVTKPVKLVNAKKKMFQKRSPVIQKRNCHQILNHTA